MGYFSICDKNFNHYKSSLSAVVDSNAILRVWKLAAKVQLQVKTLGKTKYV